MNKANNSIKCFKYEINVYDPLELRFKIYLLAPNIKEGKKLLSLSENKEKLKILDRLRGTAIMSAEELKEQIYLLDYHIHKENLFIRSGAQEL